MHLFSKLFSQCFTLLTLISELPGPTRGSSLTDDLFHPEEDSSSFFASSSDLASSMIPDATGWDPDHGRDGQSPQDSQTYTNIAALDLWDAAPDEENGLFEANPVLFANEGGACSSANGAEKRDGSGHEASCSSSSSRNNDFQNLHVPDLNGLLNTIDPSKSNEQQPDLTNEVLSTDGLLSKKNGKCSQRPYYLCCICDLSWFLDHCEDCSAMSAAGAGCFAPYMEVCCEIFGVYTVDPLTGQVSAPNPLQWTATAENCEDISMLRITPFTQQRLNRLLDQDATSGD